MGEAMTWTWVIILSAFGWMIAAVFFIQALSIFRDVRSDIKRRRECK